MQLSALNEECLVGAGHQPAPIVSLPFVHTARRCYRRRPDRATRRPPTVRPPSPLPAPGACAAGATPEIGRCPAAGGSKSRNKVVVGEPAAGSLPSAAPAPRRVSATVPPPVARGGGSAHRPGHRPAPGTRECGSPRLYHCSDGNACTPPSVAAASLGPTPLDGDPGGSPSATGASQATSHRAVELERCGRFWASGTEDDGMVSGAGNRALL